jgi:hypothetical protein
MVGDIKDNIRAAIEEKGIEVPDGIPFSMYIDLIEILLNKGTNFPVGSGYTQHLNDPDPIEKGLPGQWSIWTGRAEAYRLTSSALPAFTVYVPGVNYAANAYVLWHLPGTGYELWKAKAAITNAAAQLDPVLWEKYVLGDIVERRPLQDWLDDDFEIGHIIVGDAGLQLRVSEVIALGGTFPSWEGGNRPTFISGGVAGDVIRNILGSINGTWVNQGASGFFTITSQPSLFMGNNSATYANIWANASNVVPVGFENSPRTLTRRLWRRVA